MSNRKDIKENRKSKGTEKKKRKGCEKSICKSQYMYKGVKKKVKEKIYLSLFILYTLFLFFIGCIFLYSFIHLLLFGSCSSDIPLTLGRERRKMMVQIQMNEDGDDDDDDNDDDKLGELTDTRGVEEPAHFL